MNLAKHEIPNRGGGGLALAPGYARIDTIDRCLIWQLDLGNRQVEGVSRKMIANQCRALILDRADRILPLSVQNVVQNYPRQSYGVHRVAMTLRNGTQHSGVFVAWAKEVLGNYSPPFDARDVVGVRNQPLERPRRKK